MKLRRLAAVFTLFALTSLPLTGCGNTAATTAGTTTAKAAETTAATTAAKTEAAATTAAATDDTLKVPDKDMKIVLWDIATEDPANKIQQGAVDRFMADYPNVTVETTHIQNDTYKQKLIIAMSSGQCPNMYIHWGGGPMNEYIDSGFAVPITDLMNKYNDVKFLKAAIAQSSYNGEIYAVPFGGLGGTGIYYNKNIYEKVGIQVPNTIAELEANCEKLKAAGYIPFSLANQNKWTGSMYFMYLATRYGGVDAFNAAVAGTGKFTDDAFKYAGETIQKWINAGYFPEGVNSLNADDGQDRQLMYTEEAAMMLHGSWQSAAMKRDDETWYNDSIDIFAFPALDTSKADQSIVVGTSIGNGFNFNTKEDKDLLNTCFVLATQYYNGEQYNKEQLEAGTIPSIEGMGDTISDPCMQVIWKNFSAAGNVQLWYDQYLPPAVGETHKNTCQEIFGLTKTPDQANQDLQDAMQKYLDEK